MGGNFKLKKRKDQQLTFKTKFRIGQEVAYDGIMRRIRIVSIFVGESFKHIQYYLDNQEEPPFIVEESELTARQKALDV